MRNFVKFDFGLGGNLENYFEILEYFAILKKRNLCGKQKWNIVENEAIPVVKEIFGYILEKLKKFYVSIFWDRENFVHGWIFQ